MAAEFASLVRALPEVANWLIRCFLDGRDWQPLTSGAATSAHLTSKVHVVRLKDH